VRIHDIKNGSIKTINHAYHRSLLLDPSMLVGDGGMFPFGILPRVPRVLFHEKLVFDPFQHSTTVIKVLGEFHDQGDAKGIIIRGQLCGHNDMPCGRPAPGWPIGYLGGLATRRAYLVASVTID
jgi:hypothetical protein